MDETLEGATADRPKVIGIVGAVIVSVLFIFLAVLAIGVPIMTLKSQWESAVYSILIFLPVATVCVLAAIKSGKTP